MTEKKCYICGTTHGVCRNHSCKQEGSTASVEYCDICENEYVNPTWKEAAFWSLFKWKLNQEKCALCGKDGKYEDNNNNITTGSGKIIHFRCFKTTQNIAQLLDVSFEVALEKLKDLISKKEK